MTGCAGGGPPEVIGVGEGRSWRHETWRFTGSRGDVVFAEAWLAPDPGPVVVVGHGAEGDRRAPYVSGSGKGWARRGLSVVAADAPRHGDRADPHPLPEVIGADRDLLEWWVADHRIVLDVAAARAGGAPIGYLGVSMGALFGVHLAAGDDRVAAAVLAVGGSTRVATPERFGAETSARVAGDLEVTDPAVAARRVRCPVLMLQADRDEVFSRESAFALYDAFECRKEIAFLPGTHAEWRHPAQWNRRMRGFFEDVLA